MSTQTQPSPAPAEAAVAGKLSTLDRFLPVWIIAAMVLGLLLGSIVPGLGTALEAVKVGEVSLPIAVGLLVMMYPVLAKVRYDQTRRVAGRPQAHDHLPGAELGARSGVHVRPGLDLPRRTCPSTAPG